MTHDKKSGVSAIIKIKGNLLVAAMPHTRAPAAFEVIRDAGHG